jgi:Fe-S-cluster containining protein
MRGLPEFKLGGACRRCAKCCEQPTIQVGFVTWRFATARAVFLWWQRRVNGFECLGEDRSARAFVFRCTHFDVESRSCDSYESRPGMCHDYPRALLFQGTPDFLQGCGYRAVDPRAGRMRALLAREDLTPEQRARLVRDLHLEE